MQISFFPDTVKQWNDIGVDHRVIETLGKFKKTIRSLFVPEQKTIFGIHLPIGSKRLFQLRVGLSPLKKHKYVHIFKDTPCRCDCGLGPEDTQHYLLNCPLFFAQRAPFLESISNILSEKEIANQNLQELLHTCLYGHSNLSNEANKRIINATIRFFLESNRFS